MPANGPRILRNHVDNGAGGEVGDGDDNVDGGDYIFSRMTNIMLIMMIIYFQEQSRMMNKVLIMMILYFQE